MTDRPTLAELRQRVFKHSPIQPPHVVSPVEIGNWLARRVGRPSAVYGTWLAVRLGITAHQVTLLSLLANAAMAIALATGTRAGFIAGAVLAAVAYWLDHVDGQIARWRGTASLTGTYFDYLMHHAASLGLGFALGYGLTVRNGDPRWAAAGFCIALGWGFLALHNDCRYKAVFQRLKLDTRTFRVDGGAGGMGRPAAPQKWPRRGLGRFTWPAQKACEPHVVLLELLALGTLAAIAPALWIVAWRWGVIVMAITAPTLAIARAARAVAQRAPDREFATWFRPCDDA